MNAFERVSAAIDGQQPDRIPASVWFHFGSEHLRPEDVAKLHVAFYRTYRWDVLKVMFDYRLALAEEADSGDALNLDALASKTDWRAPFVRQQACLRHLLSEVGDEVPLIETVYSPWMYLLRHVGRDQQAALLDRPDLTAELLDRLTEETCRHVDALGDLGVFGIYFATVAARTATESPEFALQAPYDRAVLRRANGMVRFLHLHGSHTRPQRVAGYPREVLHCDDRDPTNPDLAAMRGHQRGAIMGGLAQSGLTAMSLAAVRTQVADAIDRAGPGGFLLAPGCSVSPSLSRRTMLALRDRGLLDTSSRAAGAWRVPAETA